MSTVTERFLKYVSYPTMSDEYSDTCPSTEKQRVLGALLVSELKALGLSAYQDENGYVWGTLPANTEEDRPVIGLIAHMDTSDECPDAPICPKTVLYQGGDIVLNEEKNIVMTAAEYPNLEKYRGKHLIVTDGMTLLGGDDKAGIAEILSAVETLIQSGKPHGVVKIGFTPDEEIGRGADRFDVSSFSADFAYTVDGGTLGELEYENFNAASAEITITGRSIHPGSAKNKMKNASLIAFALNALLPPDEIPAKTEGYEGFYHLTDMEGSCERAVLRYIIRDHDRTKFEQRKQTMTDAVEQINARYGAGTAALSMRDTYYNMREKLEEHMDIVERARNAMRLCGVEPVTNPIRGGTDGAVLSFMGLPCPNLSTGGENAHSRFEFVCCEDMEKMCEILCAILTSDLTNA